MTKVPYKMGMCQWTLRYFASKQSCLLMIVQARINHLAGVHKTTVQDDKAFAGMYCAEIRQL